MEDIIKALKSALETENWYAALFIALALPDICTSLGHGKSSGLLYADWFNQNLTQYKGYLSGADCYALRCALLHEGKDDISDQKAKDVLEHYVFLTAGSHCNVFKDCIFDGVKKSFLQLNVKKFCEDINSAVENWIAANSAKPDIAKMILTTIKIHEPGYVYRGAIKFG